MGHGVAQVYAMAGVTVRLRDLEDGLVRRGLDAIEKNLRGALERGKIDQASVEGALSRVHGTTDLASAVRGAEVVVEAVPEDLELKTRLFREVDALAPGARLLASNTSSLPITAIAQATKRPERVLGLHFFNPVHLQKLVEIVRGERTTDETVEVARAEVKLIGREAIVVRDMPGFASSRLGLALGLEAIRMVEQGVASVEDIDRAMELGYRHPMGPLKTSDLVGLDVRLGIAEHLQRELGEAFRPPVLLRRLVRAGKLGKKTGEGFYRWDEKGEAMGPSKLG
jgi:3-hydroxybutyryl-CoA dehydrogenase